MTTEARGMGPLPVLVRQALNARAVSRVFELAKLPETLVGSPEARIPLQRLVDLFEAAGAATKDPMFGLKVGQAMHPADYGLWVRYGLAASHLKPAIRRVLRGSIYYQGRRTMTAQCHGETILFSYSSGLPVEVEQRHHADHVIRSLMSFLRTYAGPTVRPEFVLVPYDDREHHRRLELILGVPVMFAPTMTGIAFDRSLLNAERSSPPCSCGEPTLAELRAMVRARPPRTTSELTTAMIHTLLLTGDANMEQTARMLEVNQRTLQRKLSGEGHTFRELLDRARRNRARALLVESAASIGSIGLSLGYEDKSHFTRAFRRWFATTPSDFRRNAGLNALASTA